MCFFTAYLEALSKHTPDQEIRRLVQEILEEEYMRPQQFERSHSALYRRFMRAVGFRAGEWDQVPALPATRAFVVMHLDMTLRSWLETLGAVGPGHEWAIPLMFPPLMQGIERSVALDPSALEYFRLHIELDVEHGQVLERCLIRWATSEANRNEMRRGALRPLAARRLLVGAGGAIVPAGRPRGARQSRLGDTRSPPPARVVNRDTSLRYVVAAKRFRRDVPFKEEKVTVM